MTSTKAEYPKVAKTLAPRLGKRDQGEELDVDSPRNGAERRHHRQRNVPASAKEVYGGSPGHQADQHRVGDRPRNHVGGVELPD